MVVGHARGQSEAGTDNEVGHDGLESGLTRFEIVTSEEGLVLAGHLDDGGVEGILGGTVQVGDSFLNSGDAVKDGSGEGNVVLDAVLKIIESVDFGEEEHLGVGGPKENDLVVALLAFTNVLSEGVDHFLVGTGTDVVGTISLV